VTSITLLLILAATAALAWAGTGLIIRNAVAWGLEDVPNERSSHTRVTPRGGGAAIVAASLAGFLLLTLAVVTLPHLVGLGQPLDQGAFANLLAQDAAWLYSLGPLVWIALPLLLAALVLGILGLLLSTLLSPDGFAKLQQYLHLLLVLVGAMVFVALVVNPLIVFSQTRRNPYPLVFTCLLESGIPAFFTRSSAANIPVNMALAKKLNLHEDTYSISIPLGATINMAGAAITITVLTLAAVNTMGIQVDFATALLLSVVATLGACGASGVAGGSLLLVPMAIMLIRRFGQREGRVLNQQLKDTARLQALLCAVLVGCLLI